MRRFLIAALVSNAAWSAASAQSQSPPAQPPTRFDGDWLVTISCPNNTERSAARGYKLQFPARVDTGWIVGERGSESGPGWLKIEGRIGADGHALLDAHGRTNDPEFAVNQPAQGTRFGYHIDAQFDTERGSGRRLEQRVCTFEFVRR